MLLYSWSCCYAPTDEPTPVWYPSFKLTTLSLKYGAKHSKQEKLALLVSIYLYRGLLTGGDIEIAMFKSREPDLHPQSITYSIKYKTYSPCLPFPSGLGNGEQEGSVKALWLRHKPFRHLGQTVTSAQRLTHHRVTSAQLLTYGNNSNINIPDDSQRHV